LIAVCIAASAAPAAGDPWIAPGDARLRHDLQLLSDVGIVKAPLTSWPVSWGEVSRNLSEAPGAVSYPTYVTAALARVRAAASDATRTGEWQGLARIAGSAHPMMLRPFGDVPREEGEIEGAVSYTGEMFAVRLDATAVANPQDGQDIRADGSYVAGVFGNWMLSAGLIDRWWGPGWEGSLIYGTNQRPIPAITLERNYSDPPETKWLRWIGQWRMNVTVGQLDADRADYPNAKFFAMRVTWKPHDRVEIGFSRSAQLCGDGRRCGWNTWWDMFHGNDNNQPYDQQPGNQLGGYDLRWSVPWLPLAVYAQMIGEDESKTLPFKFLGLFGVEVWGGWGDKSWRVHTEYADTVCAFNDPPPQWGCAYRNSVYTDGYQFHNRSIGHAIDGDSRQLALGAMLVNADGSSWEVAAQGADINRKSANPVQSVSPVAARIRSADVYHRRELFGGDLKVGAGYEWRNSTASGQDSNDVRGFVEGVREFN